MSLRLVVLLLVLSGFIAVAACTSAPAGGEQPTPVGAIVQEVPQRCPTPLYPSRARPSSIPTYPGAQQVHVQEFDPPVGDNLRTQQFNNAPAVITRRTTFTTTDDAQAVRVFYKDFLEQAQWRPDDRTPPPDTLYYSWIINTKPWQNPPCNATPETGLSVFLLKLVVKAGDAGETQVEIVEGALPGL